MRPRGKGRNFPGNGGVAEAITSSSKTMPKIPTIDPSDLSAEENEFLSQQSFPQPGEGQFLVIMPTGCFTQAFGFYGYSGEKRAREIVAKHAK